MGSCFSKHDQLQESPDIYCLQDLSRNSKNSQNENSQELSKITVEHKNRQLRSYSAQLKENILIEDLYQILIPSIGKGTFSECKKAIHKKTGQIRAIKIINKLESSEDYKQILLNEVDILKKLDHPNILRIYEHFEDDKNFYIVSELLTGGELFEKIASYYNFGEQEASEIMKQVLSGVAFCHSHKIVHRDLKPENLLLESKKPSANIKIIDFGVSKKQTAHAMKTKTGTLYYMSPEVLSNHYDEKCDVLLYVLLAGQPPFYGRDTNEIEQKILEGYFEFPIEKEKQKDLELTFKALDRNGDGMLSKRELKAAYTQIMKEKNADKIVERIFSVAHANYKGYLNYSEFLALATEKEQILEFEKIQTIFKVIDADADGVISSEELQAIFEVKNQQTMEKLIKKFTELIGSELNEEISFQEFQLIIKKIFI